MTIDLDKAREICEKATATLGEAIRVEPNGWSATDQSFEFWSFSRTFVPQAIEEIERTRNQREDLFDKVVELKFELEMRDKADGNISASALVSMKAELDSLRKRLELAENALKHAGDLNLEHYEWCDKVKARAIRREIPPGECDCGVLEFKCALIAYRAASEGK